jgi:hypothetical protein
MRRVLFVVGAAVIVVVGWLALRPDAGSAAADDQEPPPASDQDARGDRPHAPVGVSQRSPGDRPVVSEPESVTYRLVGPPVGTGPTIETRRFVRKQYLSFLEDASLTERQERDLVAVLADCQETYLAYQRDGIDIRTAAMLSDATDDDKEKAAAVRDLSSIREFEEGLRDELRVRVGAFLDSTQVGLFNRWSLDEVQVVCGSQLFEPVGNRGSTR